MRNTFGATRVGLAADRCPVELDNYGRLFAAHDRGDPVCLRMTDGRCCSGRIADLVVALVGGSLVGRVAIQTAPMSLEHLDFGDIAAVGAPDVPVPALDPNPRLRN